MMNRIIKFQVYFYCSFIMNSVFAYVGPYPGYGRTYPVSKYVKDEAYNPKYEFGKFKTYSDYDEQDFESGLSYDSPMNDKKYESYNLIIILNSSEINSSSFAGPPQTMRVYSRDAKNDKKLLYFWSISTGMEKASTRPGYFTPQSFSSRHWSVKYDAAMLFSVFFDGGRALHSSLASSDIKLLGKKRSSHGCVHIEDNRAEELFHLIGQSGFGLVDRFPLIKNQKPIKIKSYKTLIIVK